MEPVCPRRRAVNRLHGTPRPEPVAAPQPAVAQPKAGDGLEGRRRLVGQLRADPGVPQKAFDAELPAAIPPPPPAAARPEPLPRPERALALPPPFPVITSPRRAGRCRKCGHWINSGLEFHLKHCGVSAAQLQAEAVEIRRAMTRTSASLWAEKIEREEQIEALKETWRSRLPKPEPEPEKTWEDAPPINGDYHVPVHPEMMEALRDPEPKPVFKDEWLAEPVKRGPGRPRKIHD